MPPFVVPYLIGLVTAPLAGAVTKALFRGTVKTTVGLALQLKKLAAEASEELQDLTAEASAEFAATEVQTQPSTTAVVTKTAAPPRVTVPAKG